MWNASGSWVNRALLREEFGLLYLRSRWWAWILRRDPLSPGDSPVNLFQPNWFAQIRLLKREERGVLREGERRNGFWRFASLKEGLRTLSSLDDWTFSNRAKWQAYFFRLKSLKTKVKIERMVKLAGMIAGLVVYCKLLNILRFHFVMCWYRPEWKKEDKKKKKKRECANTSSSDSVCNLAHNWGYLAAHGGKPCWIGGCSRSC